MSMYYACNVHIYTAVFFMIVITPLKYENKACDVIYLFVWITWQE